ncbi:inositol monophosphatase family protein [Cereibacter azotoformans]|uniref:Histidinol phosphatase-like enzyme (Inositol monophosphatase family) n=2 Tax=Cereibacter TaxID=1653176 RepID=A0A2T5K6S4_9RHOB|nr:inositol monophosphatase family protein [Cereibacter azotoformans]AXQ92895.1 histidinol-phosphatase [Cereibacter sphaeroides]MBO4169433.1 inositol monophosphatase family protein [Cereibacter azotoformans]PTR18110.1 histidinol phosphatase-like enzyme (inositol monophosphatase family) [Cereibacter azotoformans]UIJ31183.1 inositol monophosphatase family protein [Cereibacter azotoformans]
MQMLTDDETAELIDTAAELAAAAREATLLHFRSTGLTADTKESDRFDPVTVADRLCEERMRAILARRRPRDAILGEEMGVSSGESGLTWVLDPIDGTRSYLCGTPTWGVLISVADETGPIYGLIDQPYIGERFEGGLGRAVVRGPLGERELATRAPRPLSEAILMSTFPEIGTAEEEAAFRRLSGQVRLTRYGADCYAYALLAAGQIDLVVEAGLQPYDVQAPMAVIEAAGGIMTDWNGRRNPEGGRVIAASSPEMHAAAMQALRG